MKRILLWIGIFFTAAWAAHFIGLANRDTNCVHIAASRGSVTALGWPLTLYWWGLIIGIITPVCFLLTYFILTKKSPPLALNNDGLFVNQQFISKMLVPWMTFPALKKNSRVKYLF